METEPTIACLCGPPGCGKGAGAAALKQIWPTALHLDTGDMLRETGRAMSNGDYCPDNIVQEMVAPIIRNWLTDPRQPLILTGFPRTPPQVTELQAMLGDELFNRMFVMEMTASDCTCLERILGRGRSHDLDCSQRRLEVYHETHPLVRRSFQRLQARPAFWIIKNEGTLEVLHDQLHRWWETIQACRQTE